MTQLIKTSDWAESLFGKAKLGDKRLTNRLVALATQVGCHIGDSIVGSCEGDEAKLEGAYRFIRNAKAAPKAIAESGFNATVEQAKAHKTLLALEDSTTLSYSHKVRESLGELGGNKNSQKRGFWVHNVLLLDAQSEQTVGLADQSYWLRESGTRGKAVQRREREYEDKESYKWEAASRRLSSRLGEKMQDVISVCDRESDIYEYMHYKQKNAQRFVVRSSWDRNIEDETENLFQQADKAPVLGSYEIAIPQKGGRKARHAKLELRAVTITISRPKRLTKEWETVQVNLIVAEEVDDEKEGKLCWRLLTSEPIESFDAVRKITRYYELRWRVEDFHKAWKSSGTDVEELRLQHPDNIRRVAVIMAFVAVRLLQMREVFHKARVCPSANVACDKLLDKYEWQALWLTHEKTPLPKKTPCIAWAYEAIARLGGWTDSKRTGVVGWATLWKGWFRLQDRTDGLILALSTMEAVS
jgi:hypothetical protein